MMKNEVGTMRVGENSVLCSNSIFYLLATQQKINRIRNYNNLFPFA